MPSTHRSQTANSLIELYCRAPRLTAQRPAPAVKVLGARRHGILDVLLRSCRRRSPVLDDRYFATASYTYRCFCLTMRERSVRRLIPATCNHWPRQIPRTRGAWRGPTFAHHAPCLYLTSILLQIRSLPGYPSSLRSRHFSGCASSTQPRTGRTPCSG